MKNYLKYFALAILCICLGSCKNENPTNAPAEINEKQINQTITGDFEACAGLNETVFRSMFNIPQQYQLQDASHVNVTKFTCIMLSSDQDKQLNLMIQLMSTPSTYNVMATGMKRDFEKADPNLKIKGLGEAAVWVEKENRKVSGISVVGKDHVVSILFDHYNTRSREELQPMLEKFYNYWLKQQA